MLILLSFLLLILAVLASARKILANSPFTRRTDKTSWLLFRNVASIMPQIF